MRKHLLVAAALALSAGIAGCGGGGGGSAGLSSNTSSTTLDGGAYSSYVANAKVCLEDGNGNIVTNAGNEVCSTTYSDGTFQLSIPSSVTVTDNNRIALFVNAQGTELKVAEAPISQLKVTGVDNTIAVTPLSLAGNDTKLASVLGAIIHGLAGDTTGYQDVVDLGNVEVEDVYEVNGTDVQELEIDNHTCLEDLIKQGAQLNIGVYNLSLNQGYKIKVNSSSVKLETNNEEKPINYNCLQHEQELQAHINELKAAVLGDKNLLLKAKAEAVLISLEGHLNHLLNNLNLTDSDKQLINTIISNVQSLLASIQSEENGLSDEDRSQINALITDLQTLVSSLESEGLVHQARELQQKINILQDIESGNVTIHFHHNGKHEGDTGNSHGHESSHNEGNSHGSSSHNGGTEE